MLATLTLPIQQNVGLVISMGTLGAVGSSTFLVGKGFAGAR
jgi:hypothetical protein